MLLKNTISHLLLTVLLPAQEYFTYTASKGLQNLGLCSALKGFEQGGILIVTPAVTRGLGFSGLILNTSPFSRLLRYARG
jgi:hypothetical protein